MTPISLLDTAHGVVREYIRPGDLAVDATLGNGHDALFLAQCVGPAGHVFGFDIQQQALGNSYQRLLDHDLQNRATFYLASHAEMSARLPSRCHGRLRAVMFNLGYLPGADKALITQTESTLTALHAACELLAEFAAITVLAYPGHIGGDRETEALARWCGSLPQDRFNWRIVHSIHHKPAAPRLFVIRKQADLL
jgi:hypothetical protein